MAWCEHCLVDHDGLCLDEVRRQDVLTLLGRTSRTRTVCPYCGVDGPYCPIQAGRRDRRGRAVYQPCPFRTAGH